MITTNNFDLTTDNFISNAISAAYSADTKFRLVADNGKRGDELVRLYEADDHSFFATTNGVPLFESEFNENGVSTLEEAVAFVESL